MNDTLSLALREAIKAAIRTQVGGRFEIARILPLSGGDISESGCLEGEAGEKYFVKMRAEPGAAMGIRAADLFDAEVDGLNALTQCEALRVPRLIARGQAGDGDDGRQFLILEWLALNQQGSGEHLAEAVAALHRIELPRFGWQRANFIGASPQDNQWHDDWAEFYIACRLRPQLEMAKQRGGAFLSREAEPLIEMLPARLGAHAVSPRLLHGDLWSGNVGFVDGQPALFDPAVYAGDPEADLAMAALFGGFPAGFFHHYRSLLPAQPDHLWRLGLYQLYHVLNHFNLFGGTYVAQAQSTIRRLLR